MVVSMLRAVRKLAGEHFEVCFYLYLWLNASLLAMIVGRPWLSAIGVVTVLPHVVAHMLRARPEEGGSR